MNSLQGTMTSTLRYSVRRSLGKRPTQFSHSTKSASSAINNEENPISQVVIPTRIERGPTDILKAISNTVMKDYLAPHFKYHDDPFLIPTSNSMKRSYAMSQESGRKAAQWIRQEHADLFQHKVADPPIEAFVPRAVYDENSEVDEKTLQNVIALHQVSDSLIVYGLLEKKNIELSRETHQALLELLCYYNQEDPVEEEWIEERWYKQGFRSTQKKMNNWKSGNAADKLFQKMSPADAASYAALICGKAKAGDADGAYKLYLDALDARLVLPVEAFNKVLSGTPVLKESHNLRWNFVEDILSTMHQYRISPNLETLNTILDILSSMSTNKNSRTLALGIIAEMRTLGIEPSLASFCWLLRIFCMDRGSKRSSILVNILDMLEGKSLTIRDPQDVMFFTEAMEVCRFHLSDLEIAYRLDKLLHTADNYNLIGDSYKESIYYRNFFALACQMGSLTEFMALYDKLVPNVYVPEPGIMEEIIKTVELNEAWELLPRLWKDLIMFEQADREIMLCTILSALRASKSTDPAVAEQHADVAWALWQRVENQPELRSGKRVSWTGQMLGDVAQVLLRADRYEQAMQVMACLDTRQHEVLGVPSVESFIAFLDKSIQQNDTKNAMWCINFCNDAGFEETLKMVQKLTSSLSLSEVDKGVLMNLFGREAIQEAAVASN